jgi:hypothetical protein
VILFPVRRLRRFPPDTYKSEDYVFMSVDGLVTVFDLKLRSVHVKNAPTPDSETVRYVTNKIRLQILFEQWIDSAFGGANKELARRRRVRSKVYRKAKGWDGWPAVAGLFGILSVVLGLMGQ